MSNLSTAQLRNRLDELIKDPLRPGDAARIKEAILLAVLGVTDPESDAFSITNLFPLDLEEDTIAGKIFALADPDTEAHYFITSELLQVFINYWRKIYNEEDPPELVELLYDEGLVHILRGLRLSYVDAEDDDNPLYAEEDATSETAITELTDSRLALIWDPADGKVFPRKLHKEAFAGVEIVNLGVEGSYSLYTGKDIDGKHQFRKIRLGDNLSGVMNDDEELVIDGADVVSLGDVDSVDVYAGKSAGAHQIRKVIGGAGIAASINANDEVEIAKKYTAIYLDHAASHDLAIVPGSIFFIKVAGNTTIANPTEFPHCHFQIILENVDGGTYTVDWGSKWVFEDDTPPAFPTSEGFCLVMDNVAKENEYIWPDVTGPFDSPGATEPPDPSEDAIVNEFGSFAGDAKWSSGVLAANGKIYCIPLGSTSVLEIDPNTNTTSLFGSLSGSNKWYNAVLATNGKIYAIPYNSTSVLEIDPSTNTTSLFGSLSGTNKWIGGLLASNGKIYAIPMDSTSVLEIDPNTNTTSLFGSLSGTGKWLGGALAPNGSIYGIPRNSTLVLKIDPLTNTISTFGSLSSDSLKWYAGALAANGKIYGIPLNSVFILEIDPSTDTTSTFASLSGTVKWFGATLAPNGKIYGIPFNISSILELDPSTDTTSTFGSLTGVSKLSGGVLAANGKIYGIPFNSGSILEISNVGLATSDMVTLPADLADLPASAYNRHQNKY